MENAKTNQIMWKNQSYQQPPEQQHMQEQFNRNHLVTTAGVVRCRFELFIYWKDSAGRKFNPFTQRGDKYEKEDPVRMFRFLLQYFINKHQQWLIAEMYDNTYPLDDANRKILELKGGSIVTNRLGHYAEMLKSFALPDWLKTTIPQPNK